jgi:alpha-aminoadipic semialdehyde synthase
VFFSHTIKAQEYNMAMLRRMMELGCNLIDYEKIIDSDGNRLIFFGRHAGLAGMIDALWALGQRLERQGTDNPFSDISLAHDYRSLADAKRAIREVGARIRRDGLPSAISPVVLGIAGYGHVSIGAQEILDELPLSDIAPEELDSLMARGDWKDDRVYRVVFKEEHIAEPLDATRPFELQDYYDNPERYTGCFGKYISHLSVLVNCIYWEERYPRLMTKEDAEKMYRSSAGAKLVVIADISCDMEGALECTVKATDQDSPVYVHDVDRQDAVDGFEGTGPLILAVDNLPCELPVESSEDFSEALLPIAQSISAACSDGPLREDLLPESVRPALILSGGKLTSDYVYLKEHV